MEDPIDTPLPLEYEPPRTAVSNGNSLAVRGLAAVTAILLIVLIGYCLLRSRETLGGISDWMPAIAGAAGGAACCTLIAINVVGRKTNRTATPDRGHAVSTGSREDSLPGS